MKKILTFAILTLLSFQSFSQTNIFPSDGNVGIGTLTPDNTHGYQRVLNLHASDYAKFSVTTTTGAMKTGIISHSAYNAKIGTESNHDLTFMAGYWNDVMTLTTGRNVGIGTLAPTNKLDIRGHLTMEAGGDPIIYTGTGSSELNRYLQLINATGLGNASGLKAGGVLVADSYSYASPGKNDLVVKGNISIGTPSHPSGYKLAVNGNMIAESVKVKLNSAWPDYVFHENYALKPLSEVERYIKSNNHLSDIPSALEIEKDGLNLGEMNAKLLKKIEELTLYLIESHKEVAELKDRVKSLEDQNK